MYILWRRRTGLADGVTVHVTILCRRSLVGISGGEYRSDACSLETRRIQRRPASKSLCIDFHPVSRLRWQIYITVIALSDVTTALGATASVSSARPLAFSIGLPLCCRVRCCPSSVAARKWEDSRRLVSNKSGFGSSPNSCASTSSCSLCLIS